MRIGKRTACDTVIAYVEGVADERLVKAVRERLAQMKDIGAVNLSAESISELLVRRSVLNPFPKIRYTERPDAASAMLMEGSVILMCDNTPSAMILPTSIFDFLQESDDYYFPPTVGTYLRLVRLITLLGSILLVRAVAGRARLCRFAACVARVYLFLVTVLQCLSSHSCCSSRFSLTD